MHFIYYRYTYYASHLIFRTDTIVSVDHLRLYAALSLRRLDEYANVELENTLAYYVLIMEWTIQQILLLLYINQFFWSTKGFFSLINYAEYILLSQWRLILSCTNRSKRKYHETNKNCEVEQYCACNWSPKIIWANYSFIFARSKVFRTGRSRRIRNSMFCAFRI